METDVENDRRLRESGLAFFGRITASVSHDINNVLSTMGEFSGLLQDFILAGQQHGGVPPEKLQRLADGLAAQVRKGAAIVKRLNRFAHTADEPVKSVDLADYLELIVTLSQRFAGLKQISLETAFAAESIVIQTRPFILQQAVFTCLDLALSTADRNHPIVVSTMTAPPGAEIMVTFVPADPVPSDDPRLPLLSLLTGELGGTAATETAENDRYRLALHLPSSLPE